MSPYYYRDVQQHISKLNRKKRWWAIGFAMLNLLQKPLYPLSILIMSLIERIKPC
ncbi:hypothetical protein HMPREF9065_01837 [Aggregatibacter sp. oral taxon 458 str. W10330]|nr:hypothetical protein HMPREF9065_01837 [Aggregatibacter sp. oral taxon 458 str. W10330]